MPRVYYPLISHLYMLDKLLDPDSVRIAIEKSCSLSRDAKVYFACMPIGNRYLCSVNIAAPRMITVHELETDFIEDAMECYRCIPPALASAKALERHDIEFGGALVSYAAGLVVLSGLIPAMVDVEGAWIHGAIFPVFLAINPTVEIVDGKTVAVPKSGSMLLLMGDPEALRAVEEMVTGVDACIERFNAVENPGVLDRLTECLKRLPSALTSEDIVGTSLATIGDYLVETARAFLEAGRHGSKGS
ncbi:MAG: hypothetical protein GXO32_01790 [Crenarchaeota archaeon]|nr:hypothetical protein [Thermoproteota archaeon]